MSEHRNRPVKAGARRRGAASRRAPWTARRCCAASWRSCLAQIQPNAAAIALGSRRSGTRAPVARRAAAAALGRARARRVRARAAASAWEDAVRAGVRCARRRARPPRALDDPRAEACARPARRSPTSARPPRRRRRALGRLRARAPVSSACCGPGRPSRDGPAHRCRRRGGRGSGGCIVSTPAQARAPGDARRAPLRRAAVRAPHTTCASASSGCATSPSSRRRRSSARTSRRG